MTFNLMAALPQLLPGAIKWAEIQSQSAAVKGRTLTEQELAVARLVGVKRPDTVRISMVNQLQIPEEPHLKEAALQTGLLGPSMVGLTLGHSILVVQGHLHLGLLSHELRHVHQYEAYGDVAGFLPVYLHQIALDGYENAPFEKDARAHELNRWP